MSQESQVNGETPTEEVGPGEDAPRADETPNQGIGEGDPAPSEESPETPPGIDEEPAVVEAPPDEGEPVSVGEEEAQDGSPEEEVTDESPDTSGGAPPPVEPLTSGGLPATPEGVLEALTKLREDVGQISELSSEEGSIVEAFCIAFLKLMEPLARSLPVDVEAQPVRLNHVSHRPVRHQELSLQIQ